MVYKKYNIVLNQNQLSSLLLLSDVDEDSKNSVSPSYSLFFGVVVVVVFYFLVLTESLTETVANSYSSAISFLNALFPVC